MKPKENKKGDTAKWKMKARPFVKWQGGKTSLLSVLREHYPDWSAVDGYCEPFVGSGAVWLDVVQSTEFSGPALLADACWPLIMAYSQIKYNHINLANYLGALSRMYHGGGLAERGDFYYRQRKVFNDMRNDTGATQAARFVFLNKTGFNGLWRVNQDGDFNGPVGDRKDKEVYDEDNLRLLAGLLADTDIHVGDFVTTTEPRQFEGRRVFFYIDPPYLGVDHTAYTARGFSREDHEVLACRVRSLSESGHLIMLSNAEVPYVRSLYDGFNIRQIAARRNGSGLSKGRGTVTELLITNY